MTRVIIESPYAGDVERNEEYARRAMVDSLLRGEAPFASHLLYTQVLFETPGERAKGIECGFAWMQVADVVAFYLDYGESHGMSEGRKRAEGLGLPVLERFIGGNP